MYNIEYLTTNKMKKLYLFFYLMLFSIATSAQSRIGYSYDAAGNRIKREIVMNRHQAKQSPSKSYEDMLSDKKIHIYPNPTEGHLKVEIQGYSENDQCCFALYDMTGKQLLQTEASGSFTELDLTNKENGYYVLHITINNETTNWKIIKK